MSGNDGKSVNANITNEREATRNDTHSNTPMRTGTSKHAQRKRTDRQTYTNNKQREKGAHAGDWPKHMAPNKKEHRQPRKVQTQHTNNREATDNTDSN